MSPRPRGQPAPDTNLLGGLSASQFTRLFKRFMGLAPMQYVIR